MTYPHLPPADRPVAAACFRTRAPAAGSVRQQASSAPRCGLSARDGGAHLCAAAARNPPATPGHAPAAAYTVCLSLAPQRARGWPASKPPGPWAHLPRKDTSACTLHHH